MVNPLIVRYDVFVTETTAGVEDVVAYEIITEELSPLADLKVTVFSDDAPCIPQKTIQV
jgi:hypothetical protein